MKKQYLNFMTTWQMTLYTEIQFIR